NGNKSVGRITPQGVIAAFELPGDPYDPVFSIAAGPDGNVWFGSSSGLGRITPSGVAALVDAPGAAIGDVMVLGGDGNLWMANSGRITRVTTTGAVTEFWAWGIVGIQGLAMGPD